jgi:tetratricopeptide (TPR) repeat protein
MGIVYLARQVALKRIVALKMMRRGRGGAEDLARFRAEAEAVARLQHPNIVQIYEIGEHDGLPFFSLEYVEGGSLDKRLAGTPQPPREAATLVAALARAMQVAHEKEVIHRDLKPANVLLTRSAGPASGRAVGHSASRGATRPAHDASTDRLSDGQTPKITDFGLAKQLDSETAQTQAGQVMGTPSYMAPEQAEGLTDEIGPWTDVWALGAILYECLTGRPPFKGQTVWETLEQVRTQDPVPPSRLLPKVPRDLETICLKCLRKSSASRYRAAQDLADDLQCFLDGRAILARRVSIWERAGKWVLRRPAIAALLAVLILAAGLIAGQFVYNSIQTERKLREKEADLRDLLGKENRIKEIANSEAQAVVSIDKGKDAAARARKQDTLAAQKVELWEGATQSFKEALERTGIEPELQDLHEQAATLHAEALRGSQERQRLVRFNEQHERAFLLVGRVAGGDPTVDQDEMRRAALEALGTLGVRPDGRGAPDLDQRFFDASEIQRAVADSYEMLVILARAVAFPPGRKPEPANLHEALALLDRADRLGMATAASHLRRAQILNALNRRAAADEEWQKAKTVQATASDLFLTGHALYEGRDYEKAATSFDQALERTPGHFWARYLRALCYFQLASTHQERRSAYWLAAKDALTACIQQRPEFLWNHVQLGFAHAELGEFEAADRAFARALDLHPDNYAAFFIHVNRGVALLRRNRLDAAKEELRLALGLQRAPYQAHLNLARLYDKKEDFDRALAQCNQAATFHKEDAEIIRLRGRIHDRRHDAKSALDDLEEAIRLEEKDARRTRELAEDLVYRAGLLHQVGRLEDALAACEKALEAERRFGPALKLRGELLVELNRPREAILWLTLYIELGRRDPQAAPPAVSAYRARGLALAATGKHTQALPDFTQALLLDPSNAASLAGRGWAYLKSEALLLAQLDFEAAIREDPKRGNTYNGLGLAEVLRGDHRKGVAHAEEALRRGPESTRLVYDAARVFAQAVVPVGRDRQLTQRQVDELRESYQERAVTLIRKALDLQSDPKRRADAWKSFVGDSALDPLREHPAFLRLVKEMGLPKK